MFSDSINFNDLEGFATVNANLKHLLEGTEKEHEKEDEESVAREIVVGFCTHSCCMP